MTTETPIDPLAVIGRAAGLLDLTTPSREPEAAAELLAAAAAVAELVEAARKVQSLHDYASSDGRGFNGDNLREWESIGLAAALAKFPAP